MMHIPQPLPTRNRQNSLTSLSIPPISTGPYYSSTIHESPSSSAFPSFPSASTSRPTPATPTDPTSPNTYLTKSPPLLPPVQETPDQPSLFDPGSVSQGSRAPLISRDYASRKYPNGSKEKDDTLPDPSSSQSFVNLPQESASCLSSHPTTKSNEAPTQPQPPSDPVMLSIPPQGPNDTYLSNFFLPITEPEPTRADLNPIRHNSAPIVSQAEPSGPNGLLPSPLVPDAESGSRTEPKSIFEIFNADLSGGAEGMVKLLKGHLDEVLRVQEEVGRMHLGLEDLGFGAGTGAGGRGSGKGGDTVDGDETGEATDGGTGTAGEGSEERQKRIDREKLDKREKGVEDIMNRLSTLSEGLRTYHSLGTPRLSFPPSQQVATNPKSLPNRNPKSPPQPNSPNPIQPITQARSPQTPRKANTTHEQTPTPPSASRSQQQHQKRQEQRKIQHQQQQQQEKSQDTNPNPGMRNPNLSPLSMKGNSTSAWELEGQDRRIEEEGWGDLTDMRDGVRGQGGVGGVMVGVPADRSRPW